MQELEDKIKQIELLKQQLNQARKEVCEIEDGYLYMCKINEYGRTNITRHVNHYTVIELAKQYNGDNGYCHIYTDNPNFTFEPEGSLNYLSTDDFKELFEMN